MVKITSVNNVNALGVNLCIFKQLKKNVKHSITKQYLPICVEMENE